jgi:CBS domain-containing protein
MRDLTVNDVMTTDMITVTETTPYKHIVGRLARHGISAVPVVKDDGRPAGIVSETDLLAKLANHDSTGGARRPWLRTARRRAAARKAAADDAMTLMSAPPVTIAADATTADAARSMVRHQIDELLVVDHDGRLIGIVGRSDLLTTFLQADADIRSRVREDVLHDQWRLNPNIFRVEVRDGVVTISGELEQEAMVEALRGDILAVDGVVGLNCRLTWRLSERDVRRIPAAMLHR